MKRKDPRRELARRISGAKLKEPPELCTRCVWAMKESGRPACPFPRCVRKAAAVETEIKIFCKDVFRALQNHTGKP